MSHCNLPLSNDDCDVKIDGVIRCGNSLDFGELSILSNSSNVEQSTSCL